MPKEKNQPKSFESLFGMFTTAAFGIFTQTQTAEAQSDDRFGTKSTSPTPTTTTTTTTTPPTTTTIQEILTTLLTTTTTTTQNIVDTCVNFVSSNVEQTAAKIQEFCENPDNQNSIIQLPSGANSTAAEFCTQFVNQTGDAITESINQICEVDDQDKNKEGGFDPRYFAILSVLAIAGVAYYLARNRDSASISPSPLERVGNRGDKIDRGNVLDLTDAWGTPRTAVEGVDATQLAVIKNGRLSVVKEVFEL